MMIVSAGAPSSGPGLTTVQVLRGRSEILKHVACLQDFAARCDQPDALHWLDYFFHNRGWWFRQPYLVVVGKPSVAGGPVLEGELEGAAIFFEYAIPGLRSWAFFNDNIVAPAHKRGRIAALAANAIMDQGAHLLVATFWCNAEESEAPAPHLHAANIFWTRRMRTGKRRITLGKTYEETLAKFGKSTRTHFRYYRKKLDAKVNCEYVSDVRGMISETDMLELNSRCMNPVSKSECLLRYRNAAVNPGGMMAGLRDENGVWLSVIGGWRHGDTIVTHWQANSAAYQKDSMVTVLRAHFLEAESVNGTRELMMYGSTSHSMHHSYDLEHLCDIFVQRNSKRARLARAAGKLFAKPNPITHRSNFLAAALWDENLQWESTETVTSAHGQEISARPAA